jgi:hypothetical protein
LGGQVVVKDNLLLPETYRHFLYPRLVNHVTTEIAPRFAQVRLGEHELPVARPIGSKNIAGWREHELLRDLALNEEGVELYGFAALCAGESPRQVFVIEAG